MSGFIALHREAMDHHLFKGDVARFGAWIWMVSKACWKETKFDVQGRTISLKRGQFCCSVRDMATAWGWPKSNVDRFLTRLKTETMIETESGTGRLIITICNYAKYQDLKPDTGTPTGTATGTAAGQQRDIKEQGNKETIEEEPIGSPSTPKAPKPKPVKFAMTDDWQPAPLPNTVQTLVDLWPPGRFEREVEQFRDYWTERSDKRPGWDKTFHNRIRDIHDRVLRDNHNGNRNQGYGGAAAGDRGTRVRTDGFTAAINAELARTGSLDPAEAAGRLHDDGTARGGELPLAVRPALR